MGWFADAVCGAGTAQQELLAAVAALRERWQLALGARQGLRAVRSDATAWRALDLLPRHLVLTSAVLARELGVTQQGANEALATLAGAGVLTAYRAHEDPRPTRQPGRPGRPPQLYVSEDLLALAGSSPLRR